jgi:hypothetical protein
MDLQFGARHRDQFGFGLHRLAHDISPAVTGGKLPVCRADVEGPNALSAGRLDLL